MSDLSNLIVQEKLKTLKIENQCFIDGQFQNALSGKTFDCVSPIDGKVIAQISEGNVADINLAVKAAKREFEKGHWAHLAPIERKNILLKFADLIEKNRLELALLETLDMGKPISESFNVDLGSSLKTLRWYAECSDKIYDEIAPSTYPSLAMMTREPIGVVAAVVPWNFPLMMAIWKIAPALATGNCIVLKPAEQSSLSVLCLAKLASEAGIYPGVFNIVTGFGPTVGKALGMHMDVDCLTFTGSTEVGKLFLQYSGQSNMKKVYLECGGKSPNVVFADCPSLDKVAKAATSAIFYNQGEVCTAGSRLIVHQSIKEEILDLMIKESKNFTPKNPLDVVATMGAVVDDKQLNSILNYIKLGQEAGAKLVCGGHQARSETNGFYIEPTIFDKVNSKMQIAKEEIFGPVLSVMSFERDEDAIKLANDTNYGLAAAVWTKDINKAHLAARSIRAGLVWVNCWDHDDITTAFGGFKQSGNGRDKSLHALDKYTELKTTWINLEND